ncbi:MAG: asparaginase [Thiomicrospira sp.]|uniref:asparaginase domain-containing protein n=1 Tax=Thiomicrospira sp. TaxID=935 RepID=UPI0019EE7D5E|nr:asparaginase domain-containing protein [Thiomicrospira sp.]MBE0493900.1 asparaginase [Thiomicrospira sp.]
MKSSANIALLACGGTIDKDYNVLNGELEFTQTYLTELLKQARHQLDLRFETLMLKDSLDMTQNDRQQVLEACLNAPEQQIVITHGTDTLTQTAEFLADQIGAQKTIVLTGAMRPFRLAESDASFNLGAALMAVQTTRPGVYIVMNGRLFEAHQVQKNRQLGVFEAR